MYMYCSIPRAVDTRYWSILIGRLDVVTAGTTVRWSFSQNCEDKLIRQLMSCHLVANCAAVCHFVSFLLMYRTVVVCHIVFYDLNFVLLVWQCLDAIMSLRRSENFFLK